MIKKVIDGFLVKQIVITHDSEKNEKVREEILGVETSEWEAKSRIERDSEYYSSSPFEYGHSIIKNGIAFVRQGKDEQVHFYYEKCIIITGV